MVTGIYIYIYIYIAYGFYYTDIIMLHLIPCSHKIFLLVSVVQNLCMSWALVHLSIAHTYGCSNLCDIMYCLQWLEQLSDGGQWNAHNPTAKHRCQTRSAWSGSGQISFRRAYQ